MAYGTHVSKKKRIYGGYTGRHTARSALLWVSIINTILVLFLWTCVRVQKYQRDRC